MENKYYVILHEGLVVLPRKLVRIFLSKATEKIIKTNLKAKGSVTIPTNTYVSVPCTIINAGLNVDFEKKEWSGSYQLKPYPIYDGAVRMKKGMYKPNTYHCLSFHIRKHIPIGKGGMILTDDKEAYDWFRTVRYEGRTISDDGVNYMLYN